MPDLVQFELVSPERLILSTEVEMVVVPGTDLEGTFNFAERMRERIGELRIPRIDGQGMITITTSCGVAAVPPGAADERTILAAADAALYEAKRTGRNKSVRAR